MFLRARNSQFFSYRLLVFMVVLFLLHWFFSDSAEVTDMFQTVDKELTRQFFKQDLQITNKHIV